MPKIIKDRNGCILNAAIECALETGYQWITRQEVAERAGVSVGSVNGSYGTMRQLKRAVLSAAVERRIVKIVAEGLADRHEIALGAPEDLRQEAVNLLISA